MKKIISIFLFLFCISYVNAQNNVGIGTTTPNSNALLHLENSGANLGLLLPNVDISTFTPLPIDRGLIVFDSVLNNLFYWDGIAWNGISPGWGINGNIGTNSTTNFIGTADLQDFVFRTNNTEVMRITSTGNIGIGTTTPSQVLTVSGAGPIGVLVEAGGNAFINLEAGNTASTSNLNFRFAATLRGRIRYNYNATPANETMELTVNGNTGVTVDGNGLVGIGLTNPNAQLHVNSGAASVALRLDNTVAGNTIFDVYNNSVLGTRYQTTSTGTNILSQSTRDINLFTNGNNRMTIDGSNGYVGISNSNPLADLHISPTDGGNGDLAIGTSGTTDYWNMAMTGGNNRFVMAYNNGAFNDYLIMSNTGNMGIGTTFPLNRLDVEGGAAIGATYAGTNTAPTNGLIVEGNVGIGQTTATLATLNVNGDILTNNGVFSTAVISGTDITTATNVDHIWHDDGPNAWNFSSDATYKSIGNSIINAGRLSMSSVGANFLAGNLGIGISAPIQNIHIVDASNPAILLASSATTTISNSANSGAVYMMENSGTPGVNANGGAIRYDGSLNILKLEMYNGATTFEALNIERSTGDIGIGITTPSKNLHVVSPPSGTFDAAIYASSVAANNSGFFGAMVYDQGPSNFGVYAHSDALPNTAALGVSRAADGGLVSFYSAGSLEGQISVSGNTITYGAFTGVHYAISKDEALERGMLVSLNGLNSNFHGKEDSEIIYGISKTTKANDARVMGAYLGLMDPLVEKSHDNPSQIMAVGNGDMWVVENGQNLEVGDYLISSDLAGYAMLDKAEFDIANIIARVGEPIDWATVRETDEGRKVAKVSVFFENFVINHKAEKLENEIEILQLKTSEIEAKLQKVIDLMGTEVRNK